MIAAPPSESGAFQLTEACPAPAIAVTFVGASGTVAGVTELDGVDDALAPTELIAVTVNVYEVPLVRPATDVEVAVVVAVMPPGLDVTV